MTEQVFESRVADMKADITDSRTRVLLAVVYWPDPYPPTVREIGAFVRLSESAVHHHLVALREAGMVEWEPGRPRTIRPLVAPVPS